MDGGAHRGGLRRRGRGAGGAPRQGPRAGVAAGGGGRGGRRDGRGGGRVGARDGNGGRVAEARGAAQRVRAPRAPNPRLTDWLNNLKYANPQGLRLEVYEQELDDFLANKPRVHFKEMDFYTVNQDVEQGADARHLLQDLEDGFRKFALSRKILLKKYVDGEMNTPGAQYLRKNLHYQMEELEFTIDKLQKSNVEHRPIPTLFLTAPELLPKEK